MFKACSILLLIALVPAAHAATPMKHFGTLQELFLASGAPEACAKDHPKDEEYPIMDCPEISSRVVKTEVGGMPGFTVEKLVLDTHVVDTGCFDKFYQQENVFTIEQEGELHLFTSKPSADLEHCMGHFARPLALTIESKFTSGQAKPLHNHQVLKELGGKLLLVDFDSTYKCSEENCHVELSNVTVTPHSSAK